MEVFTMCLSIDNLNELRATLIKVFDHPKVKKNYVSASGVTHLHLQPFPWQDTRRKIDHLQPHLMM